MPLNEAVANDAQATITRIYDPRVDLALGDLGGVSSRDKFGYIKGLGSSIQLGSPSTWVDLWQYGGMRNTPTGSFTPFMASSSASDTVEITVPYLDANGLEQEVSVNLTGQTPVSLVVTATEVVRAFNSDSTNLAGTVTITTANNFTSGVADNQSEVLVSIDPVDQQSQVLAFRVPAGKKALIFETDVFLSRDSGAAGSADIVLQKRESGGVWRTVRNFRLNTAAAIINLESIVLPPLTDFRARIRDVSDNSSSISGTLNYLLIEI